MRGFIVKNVKRILCTALIGMFALSAAGCTLVKKTPEAIKKSPIATVNGVKITKGELDEKMKSIIDQMKGQYGPDFDKSAEGKDAIKQQREAEVDQLIMEELLVQKATEKKLVPKEAALKAEVDKNFNDMKTQLGGADKFKEALKQAGFTETTLKDFYRRKIIISKISENVVKDVKVEDKQIEDYYAMNKFKYTEQPNTIHAAHILVATDAEAKAVKDRLDKGEKFEDVAKQVSTDPGTKDKGGDLGEVPYTNSGMDVDFMKGALALKAGAVSNPVKSSFGFHVIKCIEKKEYPFKKYEAVKDEIKKELLQTAQGDVFKKVTDGWKTKAKIVKYPKNM